MSLCAQAHSHAKAGMHTLTHSYTHTHTEDTSLGTWILAILFTDVSPI